MPGILLVQPKQWVALAKRPNARTGRAIRRAVGIGRDQDAEGRCCPEKLRAALRSTLTDRVGRNHRA